jgi:hypothetical protein
VSVKAPDSKNLMLEFGGMRIKDIDEKVNSMIDKFPSDLKQYQIETQSDYPENPMHLR